MLHDTCLLRLFDQ